MGIFKSLFGKKETKKTKPLVNTTPVNAPRAEDLDIWKKDAAPTIKKSTSAEESSKSKKEVIKTPSAPKVTVEKSVKTQPKKESAESAVSKKTYKNTKSKSTSKKAKTASENKESVQLEQNNDIANDSDSENADKINLDISAKKVKVKGYGGAFEIKKSKDGRFVFNLFAANKVIVATSQIYSSSQSAINGINSVITNAERAKVEDQTLKSFTPQSFPKWEIYIDKAGQFRFRLLAPNGSCICHSQGYTQKSTCKKGIESIIRTTKSAKIDKAYLKNNSEVSRK